MTWKPIPKTANDWREPQNLSDYKTAREQFSWEGSQHDLNGLLEGRKLNIAHEAVDRLRFRRFPQLAAHVRL